MTFYRKIPPASGGGFHRDGINIRFAEHEITVIIEAIQKRSLVFSFCSDFSVRGILFFHYRPGQADTRISGRMARASLDFRGSVFGDIKGLRTSPPGRSRWVRRSAAPACHREILPPAIIVFAVVSFTIMMSPAEVAAAACIRT